MSRFVFETSDTDRLNLVLIFAVSIIFITALAAVYSYYAMPSGHISLTQKLMGGSLKQ